MKLYRLMVISFLIFLCVLLIMGCGEKSTPEPDELVSMSDVEAARAVLEAIPALDIVSVDINPTIPAVLVTWDLLRPRVDFAHNNMKDMLCALRESGRFDGYAQQYIGRINETTNGIAARIQPDVITQIDCSSGSGSVNFDVAAETYRLDGGME